MRITRDIHAIHRQLACWCAALLILGLPLPVLVQDTQGESLDDLLHYAAEHSPQLREAFESWSAAVERVAQARTLPDPELSYGNFVRRSTERHGMMGRQRISITQMFPWFGTLDARGSSAEQRALAAGHRLEGVANRVAAEVRKAYAEYYYVDTAGRILQTHRELLDGMREVLEAHYEFGLAQRSDLLRIDIESQQVAERARSLDNQRAPVRAELNALLGRPAASALAPPGAWDYQPMEEAELQRLAGQIGAHPELLARERELQGAGEAERLARKRGRPQWMVGVEMMERRGEPDEGMIMLGMTLPIWRESYAAARREAQAQQRQIAAGREAFALDLEARITQSVYGLRDAERWLRLFDEALLPQAQEALEVTEAAYIESAATFVDLTRVRREVLDIRYARARTLADHAQRLAEIEELAGRGTPATADWSSP